MDREKAIEIVENDIVDYVIQDEDAQTNFLIWMDNKHYIQLQGYLNDWVQTTEGKKFFRESVEWVLDHAPVSDEDE